MLNRTPHAAAVSAATALLLGSLSLAGCSTGSNATVTHTPALQTFGGRNTARSSVQSAILVADTTNGIVLPGGPTPAGLARRVLAVVHGTRGTSATGTATGTCSTSTTNSTKQSQVTNSDGSRTTTTDYYYDTACATLEAEEKITVATPATLGNTTGSGSIISYDKTTQAVRVSQTLALNVTSTAATSTTPAQETFSMVDTASPTVGGTPTAGVGATCTGSPPSPTLSCSVAHFGTSAGATTGEAFLTTATAGSSSGNATATVSAAFYAGTGLGIAQTSGSWSVTGGSAYNTASATYGYTTGPTGTGTLTLKDLLYTYVETANVTATGLTSTIIENPNSAVTAVTNIATATVDAGGTGLLSYADGTSEPISGWLVGF
ncbi:MAG: hypothetical protein JWO66_1237 [Candidatus Eremiobacteraeota bacterium]|nr:hypothetical protein [Candidatus Eremiobacteraeota bacterium]